MAETPLSEWLRRREPRLPEVFLDRLLSEGSGDASTATLVRLGTGALSRSKNATGRQREAAYDLLTADAYITYACELAARSQEVEAELVAVLRSVGGRLP